MDAYDIQVMSTGGREIAGTGRLKFVADRSIYDDDQEIDTLLVAGDPAFFEIDPAVIEWIQRRVPTVRRYGSICTGAFILGAAGLLDGKNVTTHWECADRFIREYPKCNLNVDSIYIRDGALITAAGVTAGIDLAIALVEEDFGREIAMSVARYMVMFIKRPGGQAQFSAHLVGQMSQTTLVQKAQEFVLANLRARLDIDSIAHQVGMSSRNFARVFKKEIGMTPADFIAAARTDAARRMLEETSQPLQRVASSCGFADVNVMRRTFVKTIGVSPNDYRNRFQSTLPGDGGRHADRFRPDRVIDMHAALSSAHPNSGLPLMSRTTH